jgi:hypothetical protein
VRILFHQAISRQARSFWFRHLSAGQHVAVVKGWMHLSTLTGVLIVKIWANRMLKRNGWHVVTPLPKLLFI